MEGIFHLQNTQILRFSSTDFPNQHECKVVNTENSDMPPTLQYAFFLE